MTTLAMGVDASFIKTRGMVAACNFLIASVINHPQASSIQALKLEDDDKGGLIIRGEVSRRRSAV